MSPAPLLDLGFNLKMFSEEGCPVHLAGSESALSSLRICVESSSGCLFHLASQPSLSSHQAKYLDTRRALSNWWIFSPFPLALVCFLRGCLTPASLELGPVPSAARTQGAQSRVRTEAVWWPMYTDGGGCWRVPGLFRASGKMSGGPSTRQRTVPPHVITENSSVDQKATYSQRTRPCVLATHREVMHRGPGPRGWLGSVSPSPGPGISALRVPDTGNTDAGYPVRLDPQRKDPSSMMYPRLYLEHTYTKRLFLVSLEFKCNGHPVPRPATPLSYRGTGEVK